MRPRILYPLFASLTSLPGVGQRTAGVLARLGWTRVIDGLWHLPAGVIDRRYSPPLAAARAGVIATLTVTVRQHVAVAGHGRQPHRVRCSDETGQLDLVYFRARTETLEQLLPVGAVRIVSGALERYGSGLQMVHPDFIVAPEARDRLPAIEPVYPLTAGVSGRALARVIREAVARAPDLDEWLDATFRARQGWPAWRQALVAAHAPAEVGEELAVTPARSRLAYDELLANQLALALMRHHLRVRAGRTIHVRGHLAAKALSALGFQLTAAQRAAVAEIEGDLASGKRMLRLLQGDVGSGKTVVAVLAMLAVAEAGGQSALLAPTEVLARQHWKTIEPIAAAAGVKVALLTGRMAARDRSQLLQALAEGEIAIVVGTHALVQDTVGFKDLVLAVIDEQHRFGVHQRLALTAKGSSTHVLLMTATPIPRTLTLMIYGDLDVSRLNEKPPGRQPIDTRIVPLDRLDDVIAALGRRLAAGARAYWVCPLVEESEALDVAAAEERAAMLSERMGVRVGLLHGRMKGDARDTVMEAFIAGTIDLLVATTVIEVGVDVPAATVMVIEHAERFGLAQLHQLRGRIGRGAERSTCLLLYAGPLTEAAQARLVVIRDSDDGFRIAEEDLRLRGAGEVLGVRQSGLPAFRLADLDLHADLLAAARDDARLILERDPMLESPRGQVLKTLLYLFERDAAVRYIRSG
ncbi:MAG TPA: ATP-dependent DNA helicase RecG [Defluviicoccus sp.]|nr:ATP-dependent DNA helicase RecG [Defluviicoccus sp.]